LIAELNGFAALIQKEESEKKKEELFKKYDSVVKRVNTEVGNFVGAKKSSYVSAFLLSVSAQVLADPIALEQRFNSLSEEVRNSEIGKGLATSISYFKVGAVGTNALEFTQNDVDGKPVSLSTFKGKYVLLDFWASWCKPCRMENPNVVKVFNKFKEKNFTVLGVSLDQSKDAWVKAIQSDKLTWNHVSDLQQWNNAVAQMYHIQSIPGNFLIDPTGKIVARDLRGSELENKLCELLGCN
jgi:peroxiredoxin